ncbi:MAG: hypothetical protein ACPLSJ_02845 [Thermosulfidibacteraceae bacterium]|jgi:hypothetical protein
MIKSIFVFERTLFSCYKPIVGYNVESDVPRVVSVASFNLPPRVLMVIHGKISLTVMRSFTGKFGNTFMKILKD